MVEQPLEFFDDLSREFRAWFAANDAIQVGVHAVEKAHVRGDEVPLPGGGLLINDAYNANPLSVQAALEDLVERAGGRRTVAVLGEMAELGADAPRYHEEIGRVAARGVAGDFVECGVALGGAAACIASQLDGARRFLGFDLFGVIPAPASRVKVGSCRG